VQQARFSEDYKYIIDSDGQRVEYGDPRVVHVWPIDFNPYMARLMKNTYQRMGWKSRVTGKTNAEVFQYSKRLCSGRECLPCTAVTGGTYQDILNNRGEDEISIYYNLDQDGPCQNGAWPMLWETFAKRLNMRNIVFLAFPCIKNNYMSFGLKLAIRFGIAALIGDIMDEAENTLLCLAKDRESAREIFQTETFRALDCAKIGIRPLITGLKEWSKIISKIPLRATIEETPKVLIIGGINVAFLHYPVTELLLEEGILSKRVDFSEFLCALESENVMRYGFMNGRINPTEQFKIMTILLSLLFEKKNKQLARFALRNRVHIAGLEFLLRQFRKIIAKSGLLYDLPSSEIKLAIAGHKYISVNAITESILTVGKYERTIENNIFDGMINLGSFNCQPAMNSQAIIRPLANKSDLPYVSIDTEGPWISTNQRKLIENVIIQAKRIRKKKNEMSSSHH